MKRILPLIILVLTAWTGVLAQSPLCASSGNNQNYEWVTRIKINNGEFTSGKTGYADFTATPISTLTAGQTYNIEVDVRTNGVTWNEYVKIWFDLNQDNIIQDPTELIYNQNANVNTYGMFTGTITIPSTAFSGIMYGRMIMQYAAAPALCGTYTYGTTYDVRANIVGGVTNPVNRTISVTKAGTGSGEITSNPAGINTAIGVYSFDFAENTNVSLTATPSATSTFTGWTGAAGGPTPNTLILLDGNKTVTANFNLEMPLDPGAIVASAPTICSGESTTLTASGAQGTVYWYSGSCGGTLVGTGNPITVSPTTNTTYYARNYNNGMFSSGCSSHVISVKSTPAFTATATGVTCNSTNGTITFSATGGDGIYYYSINNGVNITTNNVFSGLSAATYMTKVHSAGCESATQSTVVGNTPDVVPPTVTCTSNKTLASCETVLPNYTTLTSVSDNCSPVGNITITQSPAAGTAIAPGATVTVTITAKDAANNVSTCTFTVTRPNETPSLVNDVASVCPGAAVSVSVLSNDTHPQGKTLAINDFTQPSVGTVTQSGNNLIYTAPAGYSGNVTFKYTAKANDATIAFSENGHYYEWVPSANITWTTAKAQAATKTYNGLQGYLVTVTSATEMAFVGSKLQGNGWMGASDLAYEGTWRWVTGPEGLENGGLGRHFSNQSKYANCGANQGPGVGGFYNNWAPGEPNDCGANVGQYSPTDVNRGGEHYAHFYGGGIWNDFPNSVGGGNILGYIVEYGGLEGCIPVLTAEASVTITVKATPVVTITPAGSTNICPGGSVTLTASGASSYQWNTGATTASITVSAAGNYTVTGTTDGCSSAAVTATVTVSDNVAPVPTVAVLPTITGECSATATAPTATDNCKGLITGTTSDPLTYSAQGTYTITWNYNDGNGNISQQTQTVVVDDNTAPVITLNSNGTLTGLGAVATYGTTVAGSYSGGLAHAHGIAYDLQKNTVWVTDSDLGNDVIEFAATQPGGTTLPVLSRFNPGMPSTIEGIAFDATDNTLWIVDFAGNVKHVSRTGTTLTGGFSVSSTIPSGTFGAKGLGITIQGSYIWIDNGVKAYKFNKSGGAYANFSFNTGQPGITYDPERNLLWSSGWNDNKYRAFDPATGTLVFTSATLSLIQGHDLSIGAGKIWVASENGSPDKIYSIEINGGKVNEIVECHGTYTDPGYTVADNCTPAPAVTVTNNVNTNVPGTYTITYSTTDAGGNTTVATRTITVLDRLIPVPTVATLPTVTGECSASVTAPTANDACAGTITATTSSALSYTAQGTYTIVWTYSDGNGNVTTQNQTVVVDDVTAPVPNMASLPTVTGECSASVTAPTATDNCKGLITATTSSPLSYTAQGTYTIVWTYNDGNGNVTTQNQTVVVKDVTPPVISCAFNVTVNAETGKCGATVNYSAPSATDNCGSGTLPTSLAGHTYMGTYGGHTYFLSNTATDPETAHANAIAAGGHLVTIGSVGENSFVSAMNPNFIWIGFTDRTSEGTFKWVTSEPVNYTNWNSGEPNNYQGNEDWAVINWGPNGTWNDWFYYSTALYVIEFEGGNIPTTKTGGLGSGAFFPIGTTTETWQATDAGGNTVSCSFTVTVVDNQNPTIVAPAAVTVSTDPGTCSTQKANVSLGTPTVGDNCPGVTYTNNAPAVFAKGNTTVTWTAKDAAGRTSTATQTVTVVDNQYPVLIGVPASITVQCTAVPAVPVVTASDNCPGLSPVIYTLVKTIGGCAGNYTLTRTWSVFDGSNNMTSATQVITVIDTEAPSLTIPSDETVQCDAVPAAGTPTATDNCSGATISYDGEVRVNGSCISSYHLKRTWTATDGCGNAVSKTQVITVIDNTAPTFTAPADVTLFKDAECSVDASPAGAAGDVTNESDNCSTGLNATYSDVVVNNCEGTYTITRTWSLVDNCGNAAADQVQVITVKDNTAPTFTAPSDVTIYTDANCSYDASLANTGDVTNESDNCSTGIEATYSDVVTNGSCQGTKIITRTWSLVDNCGNAAANQVQVITVSDNTAPIVTYNVQSVFHCFDTTANNYSVPALAATDNCSSTVIYGYTVYAQNGSQIRTGNTNNASGAFQVGTNKIVWTITDNCNNQSTTTTLVTINAPITGTINGFTVLPQGVQSNTLYLGYTPASSTTLTITAGGGTAPYTYSWSSSAPAGSFTVVAGDPSSIKVTALAAGIYTYTATVTDAKGCVATFVKLVRVVDVRCGNNMDKVLVCHNTGSAKNPWVQICIAPAAVATHLGNGSYLGVCETTPVVTQTTRPSVIEQAKAQIVVAYPNPNRGKFALELKDFASGKVQVQILDMLGRTIERREVTVSSPLELVSFDLNKPAGGVYQAKVISANGVSTAQVIIAR